MKLEVKADQCHARGVDFAKVARKIIESLPTGADSSLFIKPGLSTTSSSYKEFILRSQTLKLVVW